MSTKQRSLEQASEEYLILRVHVAEQAPGAWLGYDEVERATGIPMGSRENRDKLRRVMESLGFDYLVDPGNGYWLADAHAMDAVLARKLGRVGSATESYGKSVTRFEKFIEAMPPEQLKRHLQHQSSLAALRLGHQIGEKVYSKAPHPYSNNNPVIAPEVA